MPRKIKIQRLRSRNYEVSIVTRDPLIWFIRDRESLASTKDSNDVEAYGKLKKAWRNSKEKFDIWCRAQDFDDLFKKAGMKL